MARFLACWVTQAASGLRVAPATCTLRVASSPLVAPLTETGFGDVRTDRLIPREPFFAIRAR